MKCIAYASTKKGKVVEFTVQDEWKGKWDKTQLMYDIVGSCRTMSDQDVKTTLNYATQTWEIETGIKCVSGWGNVNADIRLDFKSSEQDELFKEKPSVLAYAYFPSQGSASGKIVFNNDYIWDALGKGILAKDALEKGWVKQITNPNAKLKTYSIVAVLIHELGHCFGLTHDVSGNADGTDVMDAFYSGIDRLELSPRDIERIKAKYGDRIYKSPTGYERLKNAIKLGKLRL